ncbi:epoxide hydrolase [Ideonella azotifigens]|uniref:Epoxide hydrolase n=1 Tax=Ideonella azotifigens TaxID=513160 RepID=A0ABN1K3Y5_9BURK|nr:epoxide hydrolase family protein [Ideonella azotifigens]MCD2344897.1 epoxide hydrolase [Ideonella azotifigens]
MSDVLKRLSAENIPRRDAVLGIVRGASAAAFTTSLLSQATAFAGQAAGVPEAIMPFRVAVPQTDIDDLKRRLAMMRWPERETVSDWSQGVPLDTAKRVVKYWHDEYDWRRFERQINGYPQFRTRIDDLDIHFIHVKSKHPGALPVIMSHGWPGSVVEFLKVIGPLTDPTAYGGRAEEAFDVVIPSLPGFGWSGKPTETGWDVVRTAKAWGVLMKRLGYDRWVAQGGDWGSGVTHALGHVKPDGLVAAHVNWAFVFPDKLPVDPTAEERYAMDRAAQFTGDWAGYFREQATRPQTIGYPLVDSPGGLALWIYEKFQAWTDNPGSVDKVLTMDEMLDDISVYWFTDTAASSARFYWENTRKGSASFNAGVIDLPMAATMFPKEIFTTPKSWAEAHWPHLIYWNKVDRGGHFAAFEQPAIFTEELRKAFQTVRA